MPAIVRWQVGLSYLSAHTSPLKGDNLHASTIKYRRIRREVVEKLGGKCSVCGDDDEKNFEIHHLRKTLRSTKTINGRAVGRGSLHRAYDWLRNLDKGILLLLCRSCHRFRHYPNDCYHSMPRKLSNGNYSCRVCFRFISDPYAHISASPVEAGETTME